MKILIADDDLTTRLMLQGILHKWGYEVSIALDGQQAWEQLRQPSGPPMAILDWMMPQLDGTELCRRLRAQQDLTRYLIMLTSRGERNDLVEGLEAGADDYIVKPYDSDELRARLNVGQRILTLLAERERHEKQQGVLEMAGAVCHELNQPLQTVRGWCELLLLDLSPDDPRREILDHIQEGIERIAQLTKKIMGITSFRSRRYLNGRSSIIQLDDRFQDLPEGPRS